MHFYCTLKRFFYSNAQSSSLPLSHFPFYLVKQNFTIKCILPYIFPHACNNRHICMIKYMHPPMQGLTHIRMQNFSYFNV